MTNIRVSLIFLHVFFLSCPFTDSSADTQYREWLQDRYRDTLRLILVCFNVEKQAESTQALVTAMRLLGQEGKYPLEHTTDSYYFPTNRFRNILLRLLSNEKQNNHLFVRFKEYGACLDVLYFTWKLLPGLTAKGVPSSDIYIQNYLDLISAIPISSDVQESKQNLCSATYGAENTNTSTNGTSGDIYNQQPFTFDYVNVRKNLNKSWHCAVLWDLTENSHKQILIVLLENVLQHLDKPVLLTDFLMDSLDVGEYYYIYFV